MKSSFPRKTLSGVDPNARDAAPSAPAPGKKPAHAPSPALAGARAGRVAANGKPSLAHLRRGSVYFSGSSAPRVDPRPLSDKAYINSCIRQLISFLSQRGYDAGALSPKTLAQPTSKDFANLALFLFRRADANFKFGSKTEDDVPVVFKQLRYPFQISKSALYSVGSPHTWPALLTALTWLVQIFVYEEEANANRARVGGDAAGKPARAFFEYASGAYAHFLAGDDATCEALERDFSAKQSEAHAETTDAVKALEAENARLESELARLIAETPQEAELQREKATLEERRAALEKETESLLSAAKEADAKRLEAKTRRVEHETKLETLARERAALEKKIASQPAGATEADAIARDLEKQRDALELLAKLRSNVDERFGAAERDAEKGLSELETRVRAYNDAARRLRIVPRSAKHAEDGVFEAEVNPRGKTAELVCGADFKRAFRDRAKQIHERHSEKRWDAEREFGVLEQNLQACADRGEETADDERRLAARLKRSESAYDQERGRLDETLERIAGDLRRVEGEVSALRNAPEERGEGMSAEEMLRAAQAEHDERAKVQGQERLAVQNVMLAALDALMGHKQQIQDALDATCANGNVAVEGFR